MAEVAIALCNNATVILLGPGDEAQRSRAHHYYQQAAIPCMALPALGEDQAGEAWRHALQNQLEHVQSAFVVLALESDFVLAPALQAATAVLQETPQINAVQGYSLGFTPGNGQVRYQKLGNPLPALNGSDALARLRQYGQAERQAWRAVLRVSTLQEALSAMPRAADFSSFQLCLSYAVLVLGEVYSIEQTDVLCMREAVVCSAALRNDKLNQALRSLRLWDEQHQAVCSGDAGFAVLKRFVHGTQEPATSPLLFSSIWGSVIDDPKRVFEPNQYVELPYYNGALFSQLTAVEFLCHAWPAGNAQYQAMEGTWARQWQLARSYPNDTLESRQFRYWQALSLGLFNPAICRQLLDTLSAPADAQRASELNDWLERLAQIPGLDQLPRLQATESGRILAELAARTPDQAGQKQVMDYLSQQRPGQISFVVLDLEDNDASLQTTFDSLLASGMRDFKLIVLKGGKPPAITTTRDTLHFIQVTENNWAAHLNQVVRQLSSEWLMLLQAGDELLAGGLLHLLTELAGAPACQAICANEVQRDAEGRLHAVVRPGADLNLLRVQPGLMARHWMVRRQTVVDIGGYSENYRQALELDLLLRLVEAQGVASLAHLDDYLVLGQQVDAAQSEEDSKVLNRHLTQLGYRAHVKEQDGGLAVDYRHGATPLVSILVASEGDQPRLDACLTSVLQRTRYPRFEVLVVAADAQLADLQHWSGRVRLIPADAAATCSEWLTCAAGQARGEYLVVLSERAQVITPAWIEALLNEALRPEVGVVGASLQGEDDTLLHGGYHLQQGLQVKAPWQGLPAAARALARWPQSVRGCSAVSADCLMISKALFEQCGGMQLGDAADLNLCLAATEAGQMVVWTPQAKLQAVPGPSHSQQSLAALQQRWPSAFSAPSEVNQALAWLAPL